MTKENLVLTLLREMRGDVAVLRQRADEHSGELRDLRQQVRSWPQTTATNFAMHKEIEQESGAK